MHQSPCTGAAVGSDWPDIFRKVLKPAKFAWERASRWLLEIGVCRSQRLNNACTAKALHVLYPASSFPVQVLSTVTGAGAGRVTGGGRDEGHISGRASLP